MKAVTLTLRDVPAQRVDCAALTPDALAGKSRAQIEHIPLQCGNRKLALAELFRVSGEDASQVVFENACDKLDRIGAQMSHGRIFVDANAGAYTGLQARGGEIDVAGDVGAFAACQMRGGLLHVEGDAGDFLGGALPGEMRGMAGGTVIVKGDVGARCGDRMRRGQILIEGDAGDYCASRMVAGTIAVIGGVGAQLGFGMQRGTVLLRAMPAELCATFADCGEHQFSFLALLFRAWSTLPTRFAEFAAPTRARRMAGDLANGGKGELLISAGQ